MCSDLPNDLVVSWSVPRSWSSPTLNPTRGGVGVLAADGAVRGDVGVPADSLPDRSGGSDDRSTSAVRTGLDATPVGLTISVAAGRFVVAHNRHPLPGIQDAGSTRDGRPRRRRPQHRSWICKAPVRRRRHRVRGQRLVELEVVDVRMVSGGRRALRDDDDTVGIGQRRVREEPGSPVGEGLSCDVQLEAVRIYGERSVVGCGGTGAGRDDAPCGYRVGNIYVLT